ncbi:MAG: hypothetical protein IKO85_05200 [Bacteroidaceae bacterium]|nr:hypothetical protein [Bacteroidaceae bacterium]
MKAFKNPVRLIMAVDFIAGAALVALCLWLCWLTAHGGALWMVPVGAIAAAMGCSLLEDFDRLRRYQKWRNKRK